MNLRKLAYRYASAKFLRKRADIISKKLEIEKDSKKRMKLIDEHFDILEACLYICRKDKDFIKHAYDELKAINDKHRKRLESE